MSEFLLISPHLDDEVLGCGGILDERFHVHYCGVDEFHIIDREKRLKEAAAVADNFGFTYSVNLENKVNDYRIFDLIGELEEVINEHKPVTFFLPYPSYNQDHRTILDAAMVALRPHDINHFVRNVLLYEEIQVSVWPYREDILHGQTYNPNCYFPIDIDRKIKGYHLHASQVRAMRSPEMLTALSKWRGVQSGFDYAEGYMAIKLCQPTHLVLGKDSQA
ncbi:MAG: hypothetical protein HOC91_14575 [Nitrospinaceae bacterium]|jgi:N-acetylglucosamine malate deacetylase 1|nr:hypothetical protein [Nitrospinaceae bacterium]MBT5369752.1 hypothetical protein [Nitrospinaceae bacterium]MBT6395749.1 hypothetical protein [Nitrospinaceae bacterium]